MYKLTNLLEKFPRVNIKNYRPTTFRIIAITLAVILSISAVTLLNNFQPKKIVYSLFPKTPLEKLTEEAFELSNRGGARFKAATKIKQRQENPMLVLSRLNELLTSGIKLKSIKNYGKSLSLTGIVQDTKELTSFVKNLEFSRGLFTDCKIQMRAISENEFYFTVSCVYNSPVFSAYKETGSKDDEEQKEGHYITKEVPVTETRQVEYLNNHINFSKREIKFIEDLLPKQIEPNAVYENLTKLADKHKLILTDFKEFNAEQREFYKEHISTVNVVGSYNDVGRFLEAFQFFNYIVNIASLKIDKLNAKTLDQPVEASFLLSTFSATEEDIRSLADYKFEDFKSSMLSNLAVDYVFVEGKSEDSEENTSEDLEENESSLFYYGYVETPSKISPFKD